MHRIITLLLLITPAIAHADKLVIHQKPIVFGPERVQLTREYRRHHYGIRSRSIRITPKVIVIHWTGTASFDHAFRTFNATHLRGRPGIARGGSLNVSAHFLIARDGNVYRLMPTTWMARHTIGLNNVAIGIENIGSAQHPLTDAQLDADVKLVRYLKRRYPTIKYLIGHHEYLYFRNTPLWQERISDYCTYKSDPGYEFMRRLRERVANLKLLPRRTLRKRYRC